jgi:hypothetical protein
MRRFAALLVLLGVCVAAAGCGGHKSDQTSPLDDALGYFAKDAPFVAAVETDPEGDQIKQVTDLVGRFPGAAILGGRLAGLTHFGALDWSRDVRPQLGAPLVIGLARPAARRQALTAVLVVAMRVKQPLRAKQLLLRQPGFHGSSTSSGVHIYESPRAHRYAAVDGDVLVAATDRPMLEQALAVKRTDNRMRESGLRRDLAGLPSGGVVRISADPRALIGADPRLRATLSVNWINSLRRLGAVVKASDSGVTLDFHAATAKGSISDADLPLAPTNTRLPLIGRSGEVQIAVHEPSRLARFAFDVVRATAPQRVSRLRALERNGVDLERQVPHHLGRIAQLAVEPIRPSFAFRADLNDSNDVTAALSQLAPALPSLAQLFGVRGVGLATPETGESFYALAKPSGGTMVFGVLGNSLVAASQAPRAAGLASESAHDAPGGAKGAAVMTLDARSVAGKVLAKLVRGPAGLFAPLAVASLRDLTGALTISRGGLNGHFKLTIVK